MLAFDLSVGSNDFQTVAPPDSERLSAPPPASLNSLDAPGVAGPYERRATFPSESGESLLNTTIGYNTVLASGPSANRVDLVILGDGYTASEIDTAFSQHVNGMLDYLFNAGQDPFPRYANFFNAHRINTVSNQSGADKPSQNIYVDTAFDARYSCNNIERLLCINTSKVNVAKNTALTGADFTAEMQFVSVNDTKYGGSGGTYAVFAGGNSAANEVALHEVAHSFDHLADEYGGGGLYSGSEPNEINVTTDPAGTKWERWHGYDQPVIGTIDAYAGGRYYDQGIYRPSGNSKMRSLGRPFDAVSREKIILDIYQWVDPIDAWRENSQVIAEYAPELWVDAIDTRVQRIEWSVNSQVVPGATAETFSPRDFGFGPGSYQVAARVYDPTDWVREQTNQLEQIVSWEVHIQAAPDVAQIVVNDGASSRSLVTSINVQFDQTVQTTPSTFALTNLQTGQTVPIEQTSIDVGGVTHIQLAFLPSSASPPRAGTMPASLIDGNYLLTIVGSEVSSRDTGIVMAADHHFGEVAADNLFRLFGDRNGDRSVNSQDLGWIAQSLFEEDQSPRYDPWFDIEGDGDVDSVDFAQFRRNLSRRL